MNIKIEPPRGNLEAWCRKLADDLNMMFDSLEGEFQARVKDLEKKYGTSLSSVEKDIKKLEGSSELATLEDASGQSF